ncbi:hypothetical protein BDB00DRAFT_973168 [Zychaea mexicana]|uniref:uncharacterized protein n=1 Tax=Zychaea mexicana TaxID=64656 RepID=UPI0022FDDD6D|nr:uncharacterized protein BDB00DRAFT_973168 [Zychaea mexicana]KAI9495139.1 hypothetical protein BDB00DRAFT_973168 [Zychaea mexicana]
MKVQLLIALVIAFLAVFTTADSLQDEIDKARKKFCGGIKVSKPSSGQVFSNPKKVKVTVKRTPNALAKVVNAVDLYMVSSNGTAKYLGTPWKGSYSLKTSATMTVDLTKAQGAKFPSQYEVRVWVRNKDAGPDCTLMSKTFKVKSSSHANAAEDEEINNMDAKIDKGCFGLDITKPAIGEHVSGYFPVQLVRDGASPVDSLTKVELFKVDINDRQPIKVQDSWEGDVLLYNSFTVKDALKTAASKEDDKEYAYFYKLSGVTQHEDKCDFYSHPFYIDA